MNSNHYLPMEMIRALLPLGLLIGTLAVGYVLRSALFKHLQQWTQGTKTRIDDILLGSLRGPFMIWVLMVGVYLAMEFSHLPEKELAMAEQALLVLGIFSVTIVLAAISSRLVNVYSFKLQSALPMTSLTQNISRIVIYTVGFLMILSTLGISITPILASLGVGGLAVALALQDTLANFFSGFYISLSKQIHIGDYMKLQSGEEGYVTDINWRTTQLRSLYGTNILIPNSKLTQTIFTNYNTQGRGIEIWVAMAFDYGSDLDKLAMAVREVGIEIMQKVPGGIPDFQPYLRCDSFPDYRINVSAVLKTKDFSFQYTITHEFIKQLQARLKKDATIRPYPEARWPNWPPVYS
jgi:small-conductance mechanosensitive channel